MCTSLSLSLQIHTCMYACMPLPLPPAPLFAQTPHARATGGAGRHAEDACQDRYPFGPRCSTQWYPFGRSLERTRASDARPMRARAHWHSSARRQHPDTDTDTKHNTRQENTRAHRLNTTTACVPPHALTQRRARQSTSWRTWRWCCRSTRASGRPSTRRASPSSRCSDGPYAAARRKLRDVRYWDTGCSSWLCGSL